MDIYARLNELGIELPTPPSPMGIYTPVLEFGDKFVYTSGMGPTGEDGVPKFTGKLGSELTLEEGQQAARLTAINLLAALHRDLGDLNCIKRFVKVLGFVAGTGDFYDQPKTINGASQLFLDVFGEAIGKPARSAIGVNALPGNIPVEIELLLELK